MRNKIFVVEDNDDIRELIEYIFESEEFLVTSFANATDFKNRLSESTPDLFLLDIMLPDGNGVDICNKLKGEPSTKDIPVLLMSANANLNQLGEKSAANDFISKPFDIDDLIGRAKKLLHMS